MASRAENMENVQIAISEANEFLQDLPSCFSIGGDSKLHHDPRKVNVFSSRRKVFSDAYPEVLKVESIEELSLVKQRLLSNPIYMRVHLEMHRRSGNTRIITHGDYVIMINTKQPQISTQFRDKFEEAEIYFARNKRFALEVNMGPVLRGWFATQFANTWGNFIARYSNFCITNFSQRSKLCTMPLAWVLCLPCCMVVAPLHCAYRALASNDFSLDLVSSVQYVKGTTAAQRAEIRNLVRAAYLQGVARTLNSTVIVPSTASAPPAYPGNSEGIKGLEQAPPSYESLTPLQDPQERQLQQTADDNDPVLINIA